MTLHFVPDGSVNYDGIDFTVNLLPALNLLDSDYESNKKNIDIIEEAIDNSVSSAVILEGRTLIRPLSSSINVFAIRSSSDGFASSYRKLFNCSSPQLNSVNT